MARWGQSWLRPFTSESSLIPADQCIAPPPSEGSPTASIRAPTPLSTAHGVAGLDVIHAPGPKEPNLILG